MKISQHILVGAAVSLPVYWGSRSIPTTLAFFLANSLIDVDHFFDYWFDYGFNLSWRRFYAACQRASLKHYIVFLHSFEALALTFIAGYLLVADTFYYGYWAGICLGFFCHLACDVVYNKGMPLKYYFLFCRYRQGFRLDSMADPQRLNAKRQGRA